MITAYEIKRSWYDEYPNSTNSASQHVVTFEVKIPENNFYLPSQKHAMWIIFDEILVELGLVAMAWNSEDDFFHFGFPTKAEAAVLKMRLA